MTKIYAHRGIHIGTDLQENTIASMENAVRVGVDGIEFDTRLTSDGVWVLHHDRTLDEVQTVEGMRYDDLVAWGEENSKRFDLLDKVLKQFKLISLNIECKSEGLKYGEQLADFLQDYDISRHNVSSFFRPTLEGIYDKDPEIKLSFLGYWLPYIKWRMLSRKVDLFSINPYVAFVNRWKISSARRQSLQIHTWTVNEAEQVRKMLKFGIDVIITDYPSQALIIRDEYHTDFDQS